MKKNVPRQSVYKIEVPQKQITVSFQLDLVTEHGAKWH